MKISKYVQTIKNTGQCIVIHAPNEIYLSTGHSIYKAPGIPDITGISQIAAVLDMSPEKLKKIYVEERYCDSRAGICGYDLSETPVEDIGTTKLDVAAVIRGNTYAAFRCDDGEMIFFDEQLLSPIKDKMKDEAGYLDYVTRIHPAGHKYLAIKAGFEVLAVILPVKILSEEYMYHLRNFYYNCADQYKREKEKQAPDHITGQEENIHQEAAEDNE